jgi:hypothetical protein
MHVHARKAEIMIRTAGCLTFIAVMLGAPTGGAGNSVNWNVHVGDVTVSLPPGLFDARPLPTKGTRWRCVADKILRQDGGGNTFSTLTARCDDGETTVSAAASCAIGAHDHNQLSFELLEKSNLKNTIRADCSDGY